MEINDQELDQLLECAVRERGAIEHFKSLEKRKAIRKQLLRYFSYSVAACLAIFSISGVRLAYDARTVGYAYDVATHERAGSEISAYIDKHNNKAALKGIENARLAMSKDMIEESNEEIILQLQSDLQEMDLLEAVCLLRQGRYFKAKRLLKLIACGNGIYADDATELLEQL